MGQDQRRGQGRAPLVQARFGLALEVKARAQRHQGRVGRHRLAHGAPGIGHGPAGRLGQQDERAARRGAAPRGRGQRRRAGGGGGGGYGHDFAGERWRAAAAAERSIPACPAALRYADAEGGGGGVGQERIDGARAGDRRKWRPVRRPRPVMASNHSEPGVQAAVARSMSVSAGVRVARTQGTARTSSTLEIGEGGACERAVGGGGGAGAGIDDSGDGARAWRVAVSSAVSSEHAASESTAGFCGDCRRARGVGHGHGARGSQFADARSPPGARASFGRWLVKSGRWRSD